MHAPNSGWEGMMLFLVNQFTCELQGRADILNGQVIFLLHFLKAHAAKQGYLQRLTQACAYRE